jgi:hypothetical protein
VPDEITAVPIPSNGKIDLPTVFAHPVDNFRVLRLLPSDPFTRKLFPAFIERCQSFIEVFHSDTDPLWLSALISNNAYQNTNYIHCLVALNEKDEIRAHAFSYLENTYLLGLHVHILQIWKSEGSSNLVDKGMELIDEYAREVKVKTIIYSADSLAKLRLYNQYGFSLHRVYGRKEVT